MSVAAQEALKILVSGEVDPRFKSAFDLADRRLAALAKQMLDFKKKQELIKKFEMSTEGIEKTKKALSEASTKAEHLRREITEKLARGESKGLDKLRRDLKSTENHIGDLGTKLSAQSQKWEHYRSELRKTGTSTDNLTQEQDQLTHALEKTERAYKRLENAQIINRRMEAQAAKAASAHNAAASGFSPAQAAMAGGTALYAPTMAAGAAAGYGAVKSFDAAATAEKSIRDIAITAGFARTEKETQLREFSNKASVEFYQDTAKINEAMNTLAANGVTDLKEFQRYTSNAAQAASAWNADVNDMANLQFTANRKFKISADDMKTAINIMAVAGKEGQFELKDQAKWLNELGAQFEALGVTGKEGLASAASYLQIARLGAGTNDEAANNFKNFLSKITAPDTQKDYSEVSFKLGRKLTAADKKAGEKGENLQDLLKDQIAKGFSPIEGIINITRKYMEIVGLKNEVEDLKRAKNDQEAAAAMKKLSEAGAMGSVFQDMQTMSFLRAALQNEDKYKSIKAHALTEGTKKDVLNEDFNHAIDTSQKRLEHFKNKWAVLLSSTGEAMKPWSDKFLESASKGVDILTDVVTGKKTPLSLFDLFPLNQTDLDAKSITTRLSNTVEQSWRFITKKAPKAFDFGLDVFTKGVQNAYQFAGDFIQKIDFKRVGQQAGQMTRQLFSRGFEFLKSDAPKIGKAMLDYAFIAVKGLGNLSKGFFGDLFKDFKPEQGGKSLGLFLGKSIKSAAGLVADGVKWLWDNLSWQDITHGGTNLLSSLGAYIKGFGQGLWDGLGLDQVGRSISHFAQQTLDDLNQKYEAYKNSAWAVWDGLITGIKAKYEDFKAWSVGLWDSLIGSMQTKFNNFNTWLSGLWDSLFKGITDKTDAFGKWWDNWKLADLVPKFDGGLFETAKDLATNFKVWWDNLSLKNLFPELPDWLKRFLDSPNQLTTNAGINPLAAMNPMLSAGIGMYNTGKMLWNVPGVQNAAAVAFDTLTGKPALDKGNNYGRAVDKSLPQEARALLDTIAGTESSGYNVQYRGKRFADYSKHPNEGVTITNGPNKGKQSTAAGRYQQLGYVFDDIARRHGIKDFSPANQDRAAWIQAQEVYKQKTKRELLNDLRSNDPATLAKISTTLSGTWTSLPAGIESRTNTSKFLNAYTGNLATQSNSDMQRPAMQAGMQAPAQLAAFKSRTIPTIPSLLPRKGSAVIGLPTAGQITSPFGTRIHPVTKKLSEHKGVDIAGNIGDPVTATGAGVVSFMGEQGHYGNLVIITHPTGEETRYAHLNGFPEGLQQGQQVTAGQVIGLLGSTGRSTGPHVHYEYRQPNPMIAAGMQANGMQVASADIEKSPQYGGARAMGGAVLPGMFYKVNDNKLGLELLNVNNTDYLMMGGNKAGTVTNLQSKTLNQFMQTAANQNQFNTTAQTIQLALQKPLQALKPLALASGVSLAAASLPAAAMQAPMVKPTVQHNEQITINVYQQPGEDSALLVRRLQHELKRLIRESQRPSSGALFDRWNEG